MKKILLCNPGAGSLNIGDQIIGSSAKSEIFELLDGSFVCEVSTHLPLSYYYGRHFIGFDKKLVLGSNLLKSTIFGFKRQWDMSLLKAFFLGPFVLLGVGWWQYGNSPNLYTKILYRTALSKRFLHSVRDEYTKDQLAKIGIKNVVNTGCPTLWCLDKQHCSLIPKQKAESVVFTLTDYNKDYKSDKLFVEKLIDNYGQVFYWPQGKGDNDYLKMLGFVGKVEILSPSLDAYDNLLENNDIDYVGTRLHAGIRSLQKKRRTLIVAIDNRAEEKHKDFSLPIIRRKDLDSIESVIISEFETTIKIPIDNIKRWKAQFFEG